VERGELRLELRDQRLEQRPRGFDVLLGPAADEPDASRAARSGRSVGRGDDLLDLGRGERDVPSSTSAPPCRRDRAVAPWASSGVSSAATPVGERGERPTARGR
jgi:hypothetical protein